MWQLSAHYVKYGKSFKINVIVLYGIASITRNKETGEKYAWLSVFVRVVWCLEIASWRDGVKRKRMENQIWAASSWEMKCKQVQNIQAFWSFHRKLIWLFPSPCFITLCFPFQNLFLLSKSAVLLYLKKKKITRLFCLNLS